MGQYFQPVLSLDGKTRFVGYRAAQRGSLKLTEHAWWENDLCNQMAARIYRTPMYVYWVGDYSAPRKLVGDDWNEDPSAPPYRAAIYKAAWAKGGQETYQVAETDFRLNGKVLVNHTRRIYMDCDQYYDAVNGLHHLGVGCVFHPLPLLTAVGNGKNGGDYFGPNKVDVGTWATDLISVEDEPPEGFTEVLYKFYE